MLMVVNGRTHLLDVRVAKGQKLPPEKFVAWNSFSRVGVTHGSRLHQHRDRRRRRHRAGRQDWEHLTDAERRELSHEGPGFPVLSAARRQDAGDRRGRRLRRRAGAGLRQPAISRRWRSIPSSPPRSCASRFAEESHGLYFRPEVRVVVEDGRSFVRRSTEKYQVLQATLVDTWASTAAGRVRAVGKQSLHRPTRSTIT